MSEFIRKIIKLCFTVIIVAIIFVTAATGVFIATFDANQYKQNLSDLVKQQTGRDLQFYGDVSLTFYPALGMQLGAFSISNAAGFDAKPMVKVNKASISVDIASLLAFSPEIDQLLLDHLEINLQKNAGGTTNWDDLISSAGTEPSTSEAPSTTGAESMKLSGAFGGLNITNAQLSWIDAQQGVEYLLQNLNITTGRITPDAPFALQMQAAFESKEQIKAQIDLEAQVQYLLDKANLNMNNLVLNVNAAGRQLPLGKAKLSVISESVELDPAHHSLSLKGLLVALDDARLNGEVIISDYTQPALSFQLASDSLDVDALFGEPPAPSGPAPQQEAATAAETAKQDVPIKLPMELLRTIRIDGALAVKQLKIQNLFMSDVDLGITANSGIVNLDPIKMNLYDGGFSGQLRLDARTDLPKYRVIKKFQAVQIGKLLTDFSGESRISGALNADASVITHGEWLSELIKNSNGNLKLAFEDGALAGFNIRYSIEQAKAGLTGKPAPPEQARKTDFSSLELSGQIRNGVFSSNDLKLQAPVMRVGGEGQVDLNDNTVNYLIRAKLVATTKGQGGAEADELAGILIPVRIDGPFADPKIDVQLDEMLKDQAAQEVEAAKARLKADITRQKAELQKQIDEEKVKLGEAQKLELEKQQKALEAKTKVEAEEAKKQLLDKLFNH